jgi:5-methylcytosine-specific restriction enzyme B
VTYEVVGGPLKRIAAIASERPDLTHVLLIDELNRVNVAKVFGELLFLLEYRDEEIRLQYSDTRFALPKNMQIIATRTPPSGKHPGLAWVADVLDLANRKLTDRNAFIGPSHFLRPQLTEDLVLLSWENSVLPFLEEYFFADPDQLGQFDLSRLRREAAAAKPPGEEAAGPDSPAEA